MIHKTFNDVTFGNKIKRIEMFTLRYKNDISINNIILQN